MSFPVQTDTSSTTSQSDASTACGNLTPTSSVAGTETSPSPGICVCEFGGNYPTITMACLANELDVISTAKKPGGGETKARPNLVEPSTIITIQVGCGDTTATFYIHRNHLIHHSPYLKTALSTTLSTEPTTGLALAATSPKIFGIFANWLYTQEIIDAQGETPSCTHLLVLWILADQLLVPALQNQTLRLLDEQRMVEGYRLQSTAFNYVYENTEKDSPIRKYIVDASSHGRLWEISHVENYPPRLLVDIMNTMRERGDEVEWKPSKKQAASYLVSEAAGKPKVLK